MTGVGPATDHVLVTGAGGQLGRALVAAVRARGGAVRGLDRSSCDITDEDAVRREVEAEPTGVVVNAAAWTHVDGCESDPARADRVNGDAVGVLARAAAAAGARMVQVSTDFVFDGERDDGRGYAEADPVSPVSAYGRSKALGERLALEHGGVVVRTAWVFGPGGKNFPAAILRRAREVGELKVVDDEVGNPTLTLDLAEALLDVATVPDASGIYHATNSGHVDRHGFAVEILRQAGLGELPVHRIRAADLGLPARRPAWSVLDPGRLPVLRGGSMPPWRDAVRRYLEAEEGRTPSA